MTIRMNPIPNFGNLSSKEAKKILYDNLIPLCEEKGVWLSDYGNHVSPYSTINSSYPYDAKKKDQNLFPNIKRIQKIFSFLFLIVKPSTTHRASSYSLKHIAERNIPTLERSVISNTAYVTNGELIAAMILKGYEAQFKQSDGSCNCSRPLAELSLDL